MFDSIASAVFYYANCMPDKLCVADEEKEYTYNEFKNQVVSAAIYLQKCGIEKKDCIAVECTQDAKFLILSIACEVIGAVFVPLEQKAMEERCKEIISNVEAKMLICETTYDVGISQKSVNEVLEVCENVNIDISGIKTCDMVEILYTTGTTGKPKGIVITNQNNVAIAENVMYGTKMKVDSVELIPLPLSHSHALRSCYANFINGSSVIIVNGITKVKEIFECMDRYGINALDLSPSAAKILLKLSKGKFENYKNQIEFIQIGTAMLDEEVKEELCKIFSQSRLYNFYGSTESGRTCVLDFNKEKGKKGCIGKPAKHAKFIVVDENRKEMDSSKDNMGLLAVAGLMNMKEYFNEKDLTASIMSDGYIYTNDIGYIDEDGNVYTIGRADDVINYRGIKIAPEEIEEVVLKYEAVLDCACVPMEDKMCGQVPKVFVVVKEKESFRIEKLLDFLTTRIDSNRMPKAVEIIDEIPRTYNGKMQRKKLIY